MHRNELRWSKGRKAWLWVKTNNGGTTRFWGTLFVLPKGFLGIRYFWPIAIFQQCSVHSKWNPLWSTKIWTARKTSAWHLTVELHLPKPKGWNDLSPIQQLYIIGLAKKTNKSCGHDGYGTYSVHLLLVEDRWPFPSPAFRVLSSVGTSEDQDICNHH